MSPSSPTSDDQQLMQSQADVTPRITTNFTDTNMPSVTPREWKWHWANRKRQNEEERVTDKLRQTEGKRKQDKTQGSKFTSAILTSARGESRSTEVVFLHFVVPTICHILSCESSRPLWSVLEDNQIHHVTDVWMLERWEQMWGTGSLWAQDVYVAYSLSQNIKVFHQYLAFVGILVQWVMVTEVEGK